MVRRLDNRNTFELKGLVLKLNNAWIIVLLGLLGCACQPAWSAEPAAPLHREGTEWCDIWMPHSDKEDKPRVLLIGDSISRGYYGDVEKHLAGVAYVSRLSTSAGICDPVLFDEVRLMVHNNKFAVIHFNNGLHGADYTDAQYETGLQQLMKLLHDEAPNANLIWASSTLVRPAYPNGVARIVQIVSRNAIGLRLATAAGIAVDDLNAVTKDHPEYYAGDNIHYNGNGWTALAAQVAKSIKPLLSTAK